MRSYLRCFFRQAGYKAVVAIVLMVLVGLLEGSGLLVLFPLLELLGLGGNRQTPALGSAIPRLLHGIGSPVTLPVLLGLSVLLMGSQLWLRYFLSVFGARLENAFGVALREKLYSAMVRADWLFFTRQRGSNIIQILTGEVDLITSGTQQLLALLATAGVGGVQLAFAFALSPQLTLLAISCGALLLFAVRPVTRRAQDLAVEAQKKRTEMMTAITEHLGGMKIVKSQGREVRHLAHFHGVISEIAVNTIQIVRVYAASRARYEIGSVLALAVSLYSAVRFTSLGPAELLLFVFIFTRLLPRLSGIHTNWQNVARMLPSFATWNHLRCQFKNAREPAWACSTRPMRLHNEIRFERVSFSYGDGCEHGVISEVDLVIPARQTVAICGPSGAGKTTLADILMGLLQPSKGRVLIDEKPLQGGTIHEWRRSIGYVPQEPFLFNETIRANLLWAQPSATDEELCAILRAAAAKKFVDRLPLGLDTIVGDRGVRLSGGERQRLMMARALLTKPSMLVLDEATSSLDQENERLIQEAVNRLHGELTIIVIAHRLSTLRSCDWIVVLDQGRVVEQGATKALLTSPESFFAKMVHTGHAD